MLIGAQMYTVRDFCKNTVDFAETLKKIADIGYKTVQVSGTCDYDAEWLRDELKKNGLSCVITHTPFDKIINDTETVIANHKTFGCKYIGLGCMPKLGEVTREVADDFISKALPAAEKIKESGCLFMYHNHSKEFTENIDGWDGCVLDYLAEKFPVGTMGFTLDTHWVKVGGFDPIEYLEKLAGRTPCVHFKDLVYGEDGKSKYAPVGSGLLDFGAIISTCEKLGVEYALVEQDDCYGRDPFDCLKESYDYLKSEGLN